jgi:hypothetical protein
LPVAAAARGGKSLPIYRTVPKAGAMTQHPVLLASGHMVDLPDRQKPRFPADQLDRVTAEVRATLAEWAIGPGTTVVTGGARGADLIVAEEARARGAQIVLCLALPMEEFERRSVDIAGTDWLARFRRIADTAEVRQFDGSGEDVFAQANGWMIDLARSLDPEPRVILVWDGRAADGPGGTRDMLRQLGIDRPGPRIRVVDPTRRSYEARQSAPGPKRMLSLDGGGMRGILSLEILETIETRLRNHYDRPDLVLADYFDYIAGTSTGAIIATALAFGSTVEDVKARYRSLGAIVFRKRRLPLRLRSLYVDKPLRRELGDFFGADRTLGDPDLRTLLLVVMHNTVTDSPWTLSNCTRAKYNLADRNLLEKPDRNLDILLAPLVRASTAAPIYFTPEELEIGRHKFLFQDGGVTPFNNPALMMFLMATLPEYKLRWPTGEDKLLIVSVGTGSSAAVHPDLRRNRVTLPFNARNLPSVFMNGAAVSQDLLCRSFGRCRAGGQIDREVAARIDADGVGGTSLFTYVRYNADLSDRALIAAGVGDLQVRKRVRKLDAVDQLPLLQQLGQSVAAEVDLDAHFAGFLDPL